MPCQHNLEADLKAYLEASGAIWFPASTHRSKILVNSGCFKIDQEFEKAAHLNLHKQTIEYAYGYKRTFREN